ncbi:hypothetical protein D9M72_445640 [compost metagenome]
MLLDNVGRLGHDPETVQTRFDDDLAVVRIDHTRHRNGHGLIPLPKGQFVPIVGKGVKDEVVRF